MIEDARRSRNLLSRSRPGDPATVTIEVEVLREAARLLARAAAQPSAADPEGRVADLADTFLDSVMRRSAVPRRARPPHVNPLAQATVARLPDADDILAATDHAPAETIRDRYRRIYSEVLGGIATRTLVQTGRRPYESREPEPEPETLEIDELSARAAPPPPEAPIEERAQWELALWRAYRARELEPRPHEYRMR